ncbi:MAG: hypothetical protein B6229_01115 [Spirochaetaceae bacterium 4572_7]|nr:MAG: hypothetical protein B6229_01115 [Spirochaetaceae bacterium 4572_7]
MKNFLILILIFSYFPLIGEEVKDNKILFEDRVYDPFFSATVVDNQGEEFLISRASFFDEFNDKKFFFWVRRNSGLYSLSFKNIKKINFSTSDYADTTYKNFTKCSIELVTGEKYPVYLKTTGYFNGWDQKFGAAVTFYLHYNLITSIEFHQDGEYKICPFCGTIYFDSEIDECIYDKTPLIEGLLAESDK